jgi:hypothetical protein
MSDPRAPSGTSGADLWATLRAAQAEVLGNVEAPPRHPRPLAYLPSRQPARERRSLPVGDSRPVASRTGQSPGSTRRPRLRTRLASAATTERAISGPANVLAGLRRRPAYRNRPSETPWGQARHGRRAADRARLASSGVHYRGERLRAQIAGYGAAEAAPTTSFWRELADHRSVDLRRRRSRPL